MDIFYNYFCSFLRMMSKVLEGTVHLNIRIISSPSPASYTHSHLFTTLSIHFHMPLLFKSQKINLSLNLSITRPIVSYTRTAYHSTPQSRSTAYASKSSLQDASPGTAKSDGSKSGGVPGWLRVLVFIIVAVFLYYLYSTMESADTNPFKTIDA